MHTADKGSVTALVPEESFQVRDSLESEFHEYIYIAPGTCYRTEFEDTAPTSASANQSFFHPLEPPCSYWNGTYKTISIG